MQRRITRSKYSAKKAVIDGITFDSRREARRYQELKLMSRAGAIADLNLQPEWNIVINGVKVCAYRADFAYRDLKSGRSVVEDAKGMRTPLYSLKRKLMLAVFNIEITEV